MAFIWVPALLSHKDAPHGKANADAVCMFEYRNVNTDATPKHGVSNNNVFGGDT